MGRSPRDFESRASTSFTTPALCEEQREVILFYHIRDGVSRVLLVKWSSEESPGFASQKAVDHPNTPPPTMTTSPPS